MILGLYYLGMFSVNRLTENFRLTGLSTNRTETGYCIPKPHHLLPHLNPDWFLPRDAMHPRYSHEPVALRPTQVGVLLRRLNESSWFLAYEVPSTRSTLC